MSDDRRNNAGHGEIISDGADNRISAAVVYTDQAYIKREAQASANSGLNRFLVEIRSFAVDVDSVKATVFGEGEILGVQYREIPVKYAPQEEVRELEDRKDQLKHQERVLKNEQKASDKQMRFLDSVVGFAETDLPKKIKTQMPSTENLAGMLEFLDGHYRKLADQNVKLRQRLDALDREKAVVKRQLKKLRPAKERSRRVIEVLFESPQDQEVKIEASYVARSASWAPVYKVDVPLDLAHVGMTMFARIRQETGEDWDNVMLTVSNAVPVRGSQLPDISSWRLRFPADYPPMAGGALPVAAAMDADAGEELAEGGLLEEDMEALVAGAPPEAAFQQALQRELPLAFEYELPRRIRMGSGDDDTLLPIFTRQMEGDFFIYTVPASDPLAYLVGRIAPDRALLEGRLNIHLGGRFVGSTHLSGKRAGEDLLVNLGVERGVKTEREKITDKISETFFGRVERTMAARELVYRIRLENLKDEAVRIQLLDRVPVSTTDRIQVKGVEIAPEPADRDYQEREGVMKWDLQLQPGSIQEIHIKFFVKHPKDRKPQGL